ncbi:MAG: DUF4965 domain-containing protein [Candidatus Sumerlaeia bacterium]|nr:DUF4965 domain-containing protein [Candidatus Sumerlaeia bacterium]
MRGVRVCAAILLVGVLAQNVSGEASPVRALRPPSVPLVACDPYFSIWSPADKLTDAMTCHWTGRTHYLGSLIRVDGKVYRLMGTLPKDVPALPQSGLPLVLPTQTVYTFQNKEVEVTLTFLTPALPKDLDVLARPVTYLIWTVSSRDEKEHEVVLYYDNSAELVVNTPDQQVVWERLKVGPLAVLKMGMKDQAILGRSGDNLRIEWGYLYVAAPEDKSTRCAITSDKVAREGFAAGKPLPAADDTRMPRAAQDDWPVAAFTFDLGKVGGQPVSRHLILAYDDLFSIEYLGVRQRPWWRRNGWEAADLLKASEAERALLQERCAQFDAELMKDLLAVGGEKYARICALAYRQCQAANKITVDAKGRPMMFPKENFSNGCIGTVDVIYPQAPQNLLLNPTLAKATLTPVLEYAQTPRWKFPFAPHDLGRYPLANGQVYGGGETSEDRQMPVEECGNMLLLMAAIAKIEGNADYAAQYWPLMTKWAEYLREKGFDPENQLCTDDFAGHLAHNVNLSAKAILALGAYAMMCDLRGLKDEAAQYRKLAGEFAAKWCEMADDGDHYRLAFDKPGTWSQKYNLVWDRLLGLHLFPAEVIRKEIAYYKKVQNRYGLPLDNRQTYTKLDWILWTATLAESRSDFDALVAPVYDFLNDTPDRVPMTDWYWTLDAKKRGFQARSVVGGVFIKLMSDPAMWKKWAGK